MNFIPDFRSTRFNTSRVLTIVIALAAFGAALGTSSNLYGQTEDPALVRYNKDGIKVASGTRVNLVLSNGGTLEKGDIVMVEIPSSVKKHDGTFSIPGGADFTLQSNSRFDIDFSPCGKDPAFKFENQTDDATLTLTNVGYYGSWYGGNQVFLHMSDADNFLTLNLNNGVTFYNMKGVISSGNSNSKVKINANNYISFYDTTFGFGNWKDTDDDDIDEGKPLKVDISFTDQVNSSLTLSNNTRGVRGSAAYTSGFTSTSGYIEISSNSASDSGGTIYATGDGNVSLTANGQRFFQNSEGDDVPFSIRISENTATNSGGFIYSDSSGNINITSRTKASLTSNRAYNGSGGVIYNEGKGNINIVSSDNEIYVYNNFAGKNGGMIYNQGEAASKITFDANVVTVTDNFANTGSGGFIYNEGASADIKSVAQMTIKRNYAYAGNGGAIYSGDYNGQAAENTIKIVGTNNLTISNNYAGYTPGSDPAAPVWNTDNCNGGAIYSTAKELQIATDVGSTNAKLTFENNFATGDGGAIYNASSATSKPLFSIHGKNDSGTVTVSRNKAGGSGGAVYNANAEMDFISFGAMSFQQNEAGISGGAIYNSAPDYDFNLECISLEFSRNTASENGGAIYLESKKNVIEGTHLNFKNNEAGENGGAIYEVATSGGSTTFNALKNLAITDNIANAGSGGAIYRTAADGATNIGDLSFNAIDELVMNRNYAENDNGGAIYNDANSDIKFKSNKVLSIKNNSAINGGAIYQSGGGIVFDGTVIQDDPSQANFFNNVATGDESTLDEALANDIYCSDKLSFKGKGVYTFNGGIYADSTSISEANVTVYGREFLPGTETPDTTNHFRFNQTTISNDGKLTVQFDEIEDYSGVFTLEKKTENATMLELNTETKTRQLTMEEDKLQVLGNGVVEKTGHGALQIVAAADGLVGAESFVISSGRVDYAGYLDASLEVEKGAFSPGSFEDTDLIGNATVTGDVQIKDLGIALFEFGTFPGNIEDVNNHDVLYISDGSFVFDPSSDKNLIALAFLKGDKDAWAVDDCWYLLIEGANVTNGDYSYLLTSRYGSDSTHRQLALVGKDGNLYLTTTYYVPEPSTWALMIFGAAGLLFWRKRK